MSDITFTHRVEKFLDADSKSAAPLCDAARARFNGTLGIIRALREVDTSVRLGLKDLASALGRHLNPTLLHFERPGGELIWLDAKSIHAVHEVEDGKVALEMPSGRYTVVGELGEIGSTVLKAVNAW